MRDPDADPTCPNCGRQHAAATCRYSGPVRKPRARLFTYRTRSLLRSERWRWRLTVAGETVADSAEGYTDRAECLRMGRMVTGGGYDVEVRP